MKCQRLATLLLTLVLLLQSSLAPSLAQLTPGEETSSSFASTDSQNSLYTIFGQVTDGSGNGIAGVAVTATPGRPPLIFIPGVGGSILKDKDPRKLWPLWPNVLEPDDNLRVLVNALLGSNITELARSIMNRMAGSATDLQLAANDSTTDLIAPDVIRWVVNSGVVKEVDIYGSFLSEFLEGEEGYRPYQLSNLPQEKLPGYGCDLTQADNKPTLFVFPYDWRLPIEQSAQRLSAYITECVHQFYPGSAVDIVAHSMGGLVARRYILAQEGQGKSNHVRRMITLGTPWLGAPKMLHVLLTGDFDFNTNLVLLNKDVLKQLIKTYPGVHALLPSSRYFQLIQSEEDYPIIELGWDLNGNNQKQDRYGYVDYKAWLNQQFKDVAPATINEQFHSQPGQDNWYNDASGVEYHHIHGNVKGTILQIGAMEYCYPNIQTEYLNFDLGCTTDLIKKQQSTGLASTSGTSRSGDGTVPFNSATGNWVSPPGGAVQHYYEFQDPNDLTRYGHGKLPLDKTVQDCIKQILNTGVCSPAATVNTGDTRQNNTAQTYEILVIGTGSATVMDSAGRLTGIVDDFALVRNIPDVYYYETDGKAVQMTAPATEPLTVTFKSINSPLLVEILKSDSESVVEAVRYVDLIVPPNTTMALSLPLPTSTALTYDSSGDGVPDRPVAASPLTATGALATDTQPPTVTISIETDRLVTITAEDVSGVKAIYYSTDGVKFDPYVPPMKASDHLSAVHAFADDNVGNRSSRVTQPLEQPKRIYLPFTTRGSQQRTMPVQDPLPAAEPRLAPEPQPAQQPVLPVQPATATQVYTATTGADGRYTLSNLPAGAYEVTARRIGWAITPAQKTITVPSSDANNLDFTGTSSEDGIEWDTPILIQSGGDFPQIAIDTSDKIYVSWRGCSDFICSIFVRRSDTRGLTWTDPVLAAADARWPHALHSKEAGKVHIGWLSNVVSMTRSIDFGNTFINEVRIDQGIGHSFSGEMRPRIAEDHYGNLYVLWGAYYEGVGWPYPHGIFLAKFSSGGSSLGPTLQVDDRSNSRVINPSIAIRANGIIYIVWADYRDGSPSGNIFFTKSIDGGVTFEPSKRVNDVSASDSTFTHTGLAVDDNDHIYVVWVDSRNNNQDIYFSRSANGGISFEPNIKLNDDIGTAKQSLPSIAISPTGQVLVSWHDTRNIAQEHGDIYTTVSNDGGTSFSRNTRVNPNIGSVSVGGWGMSYSVFDSKGEPHIVWADRVCGGQNCIFYSTMAP